MNIVLLKTRERRIYMGITWIMQFVTVRSLTNTISTLSLIIHREWQTWTEIGSEFYPSAFKSQLPLLPTLYDTSYLYDTTKDYLDLLLRNEDLLWLSCWPQYCARRLSTSLQRGFNVLTVHTAYQSRGHEPDTTHISLLFLMKWISVV